MRVSRRPLLARAWMIPGDSPIAHKDERPTKPRRSRSLPFLTESLEPRVVLNGEWGGGNLLGSALNAIGVLTGPALPPASQAGTTSSQSSQLRQDIETLRADLATAASTSGLTIADLSALASDSQTIAQSGSRIDVESLDTAVKELADALTGGTTPLARAQSDFQAVFTGANVSSDTVTAALNDVTKAITDSGVTNAQLTKIAADQAAIQTDLSSLPRGGHFGGGFDGDGIGIGIVEGRPGGGNGLLSAALSATGVVTNPGPNASWPVIAVPIRGAGSTSQLQTDLQALHTELSSLASKSGLTVADLTSLASDGRAILQSRSRIDMKGLEAAVSELALALTGGTTSSGDTVTVSQAQVDFQAVFANTGLSSDTITTAFNDLSKAIIDSGITSEDLAAVSADQAAIQADLSNVGRGENDSGDSGTGTGTATGGNCNGGSSSSSDSSSTSGSSRSSSNRTGTTSAGTSTPPLPTGSASLATGSTTSSSSSRSTTRTTTGHHHEKHAAVAAGVHPAKARAEAKHSRG